VIDFIKKNAVQFLKKNKDNRTDFWTTQF